MKRSFSLLVGIICLGLFSEVWSNQNIRNNVESAGKVGNALSNREREKVAAKDTSQAKEMELKIESRVNQLKDKIRQLENEMGQLPPKTQKVMSERLNEAKSMVQNAESQTNELKNRSGKAQSDYSQTLHKSLDEAENKIYDASHFLE